MSTAKKKITAKKSPRTSATKTATKSKSAVAPKRATKKASAPAKAAASRKVASAKRVAAKPKAAVKARGSKASNAVDEQLARYRSMRDFHITDEPSGSGKGATRDAAARTSVGRTKNSGGLPFVIQKHAASHLHYDFRLGWNGVLKSWAVAKGPSYFTGDRRLAVEVEDHPMEYGGFEGIIPKGQYGGGTVMVWDQGTWWPQPGHEDVAAGLRAGSLKFEMSGKKMKGKWTLVRMNPRSSSSSGSRWGSSSKPNWLLIKEHDEYERGKDDPCITVEAPNSAVTGRTMEQIAAQEDHVWNSKETAGTGRAWYRQEPSASHKVAPQTAEKRSPAPRRSAVAGASARRLDVGAKIFKAAAKTMKRALRVDTSTRSLAAQKRKASAKLSSLPQEKQPTFVAPELALETTTPPGGAGWLHELKLDGYRIQARKSGDQVQLLTRKGLDWTHRMPSIAEALAALPVDDCTIDGEVVVLGADGTTSFADLQAAFQEGTSHRLTYFCFDLLHLDGRNTRGLPLLERKALLAPVLANASNALRYSEHIETGGEEMFHKACELHAEGIISKRSGAAYVSGRGGDWLKSKCLREQELVIGGYTFSSEGADRIGSLLLGYYSGGEFIYAGRTGTGFTQKTRRSLLEQLQHVARRSPAFDRIPNEARRDAQWVEPKLVAQVRFATWTADNLVRQAAFLGLREDKPALEVHREEATVAPRPKVSHKAAAQLAAMTAPAHGSHSARSVR